MSCLVDCSYIYNAFMQKILKTYLKRLTNLSSGNKSLLLLNLPSEQFMDLHGLDFLNSSPSFDIVEQLIAGKKKLYLCDLHDSRFDKVNEASTRIKKINRTEKFIEEERGAQDLYVGYPFIHGKLSDGTLIRCPLLFFPVSISLEQNRWILSQREEEEVTLNKSFLLAYAYFNGVTMADQWLETSFEDFSKDSLAFRTQLYQLLKESPVEINFNKDLFNNILQTFTTYTKADFEAIQRNGELKLYPEAVLGIFPQAGSYLVPDYQTLLEKETAESLEDFFYTKHAPREEPQLVREEHLFTPFAIDASQEKAIKLIKSGQSMVVQGPPGTGKSQLICNLIADYIARGKKVLLVCQKRVALDVVYNRLKEVGLTTFTALVHDFKHDRKAVYDQIISQIDKVDTYKEQNRSLDAIFLERTFLQESRKIDKFSQELEEFRTALFDDAECGLSIKELYLTSDPALPAITLKSYYKYFPFHELDSFLQKLSHYEAYAIRLERENYIWKNRRSFAQFNHSDLLSIVAVIKRIPLFGEEVALRMKEVTGKPMPLEQIEALKAEVERLEDILHAIQDEQQWAVFKSLLTVTHSKAADLQWLKQTHTQLISYINGTGIEKSLPAGELENFEKILNKAVKARNNFLTWLFWQWFSKDKAKVQSVVSANNLSLSKEDLETLLQKLTNRIKADQLIDELKEIREIEQPYEPQYLQQWFSDQERAILAKNIYAQSSFLQNTPILLRGDYGLFKQKINELFSLLKDIALNKNEWRFYLTDEQITNLLTHVEDTQPYISTLQEDFDALCEIDTIKNEMSAVEKEVTNLLWTYLQSEPAANKVTEINMVSLFDNSLRLAWIEHIETKYPLLKSVSTLKLAQLEEGLQESVLKKMQLSRNIVLLKAREKTYQELAFNRLNNLITYRDLKHQASKKRNIWQMRKLLEAFADEIFQLIPCWMASPESVSAIFGMDKLFDLVIFDEASQCFAERGIPAMYRAHQIVVTGDARQLTPNDLYRVRFEEETDDTPQLEVDSLLDLTAQYFPQIQLNGHYRSKALELIDFSNRHFYKDSLQLLPDRHYINKFQPAIAFIKVEGTWQNNTNVAEAEEVVKLVSSLIERDIHKEIGIVTFNFKQQNLIQDLLEEAALENRKSWPESLFVKNIENVQGDERDIIIFSVGYAPDAKGRLVMQFGSLNMQGGENRLNVAITRAREQIYVVSSIFPTQLKTEDSLHKGPGLFKDYLAYALQVSNGEYKPTPKPVKGFQTQIFLKDRLYKWQNNLAKELPFADITIKKGNHYDGLLLTDDDLYHQSLSAKDAHAYTPFLLRKKNWPFMRVYSREYWRDKDKVKEKIVGNR